MQGPGNKGLRWEQQLRVIIRESMMNGVMLTDLLIDPNALMVQLEFVVHGCWIHWLAADKDGQVVSIAHLPVHAVVDFEGRSCGQANERMAIDDIGCRCRELCPLKLTGEWKMATVVETWVWNTKSRTQKRMRQRQKSLRSGIKTPKSNAKSICRWFTDVTNEELARTSRT